MDDSGTGRKAAAANTDLAAVLAASAKRKPPRLPLDFDA